MLRSLWQAIPPLIVVGILALGALITLLWYPQAQRGPVIFATIAVAIGTPEPSPQQLLALVLMRPTAMPTQPAAMQPAGARPTYVVPTAAAPALTGSAAHEIGYVPILMYHYIREVDEAQDPLGFRLSVRPDRFAEQMAWIVTNHYTPVLIRDLVACLRAAQPCPERPVAVTFDDGYADNLEQALPILQHHGIVATFYVVPNFVGKPGYMSWQQLAQLRASGMEIGSHTMSHANLTGLTREQAQNEIVQSRTVIEQQLDVSITSFCYPAGGCTPELAELVRETGYSSAVTTYPGTAFDALYELPRRRVLGSEVIEGFPWYFVPVSP